jgi:hypothetical protein
LRYFEKSSPLLETRRRPELHALEPAPIEDDPLVPLVPAPPAALPVAPPAVLPVAPPAVLPVVLPVVDPVVDPVLELPPLPIDTFVSTKSPPEPDVVEPVVDPVVELAVLPVVPVVLLLEPPFVRHPDTVTFCPRLLLLPLCEVPLCELLLLCAPTPTAMVIATTVPNKN